MSFEQLRYVTKLGSANSSHFSLVHEWDAKRQHLAVYLQDIPLSAAEYVNRVTAPYDQDSKLTIQDPFPRIRLSSLCEAATNCLYGMAEIAAQFANKASAGQFPSNFNALRKKAERGEFQHLALADWLDDFGWYKKVRELRTEWVHFSTVFIGEDEVGQPVLSVSCLRRDSDREMFNQKIRVPIPELIDWIVKAMSVIDNLGNYVLVKHVIPKLDLAATVIIPKYDANGWPIFKTDFRVEIEEITIAEYLARGGIEVTTVSGYE